MFSKTFLVCGAMKSEGEIKSIKKLSKKFKILLGVIGAVVSCVICACGGFILLSENAGWDFSFAKKF